MHKGGVEARLGVEADRSASHEARLWVRSVLSDWALDHLSDDVEMVVGELVVNVVLHAATPSEVVLRRSGEGVLLEVVDRRPDLLPQAPTTGLEALFRLDEDEGIAGVSALDAETTTGRGLLLVSAVSDAWGVTADGDRKTVWAQIGGASPDTAPAGEIIDMVTAGRETPPDGAVTVRLAGIPTRLVLTSSANLDDLVREFRVAGMSRDVMRDDLAELAENFLSMTSNVRQPFREAAVAAIEIRRRLLDVTVAVPPAAVPTLRAFREVIDQIVFYCQQGALLSLAPPPEVSAFRRWYVDEIDRQVGGARPRACPFPVLPPDDPALRPQAAVSAPVVPRRREWIDDAAENLARARDVGTVTRLAINSAATGIGATSGSLCLLDDDGITVRLVDGVAYPQETFENWATFEIGDDVPASEAIRTGEAVFLRTLAERDARYPSLASGPVLANHGLACLPVVGGCLVVGFSEPRRFDEEERGLLRRLAYLVSEALVRTDSPGAAD